MPRWLPLVLKRIRELAVARRVYLTMKGSARTRRTGLWEDACDLLANLDDDDSAGRLVSEVTGEWMYVFKPTLAGAVLYVKLIIRTDCVVVSFHDDEGPDHDQEDA
jgi:hypothetical protein